MAQAVERRLPAIYDALDSRNNKVSANMLMHYLSALLLLVSRRMWRSNDSSLYAVSFETNKQRFAKASKASYAPHSESSSIAADWQRRRGLTGTT